MEEGNCKTMVGMKKKKRKGSKNRREIKSRKEMRKRMKSARCALLHVSAWSTDKKYTEVYKGTFDIFFRN